MLDFAKAAMPWLGIGMGALRGEKSREAGDGFHEARGFGGAGLAATRLLAGGAGTLGPAAAGAGAGLGMAAGLGDSMSVLGHAPSRGVDYGMTGVLGVGNGILGAARPDTLPFLSAGGLGASALGMAATNLEKGGHHTLASGAAMLGMGSAGAGEGAAIGETVAGPAGALVGAGLGAGAGLVTGGVMEIANDDKPEDRIASISDGHGVTGGEAMGIGSLALGGAAAGAAIGSIVPAVGTAIGAGVGAGVGAIGGLISSLWD